MRRLAIAGLCLGLAACGATVPVAPPVPDMPPVPAPAQDTCGAAPYAMLVGQPATALERVLIMRQVRLIRPDTPVTEDFRPQRINFHIATPFEAPEYLQAISCG